MNQSDNPNQPTPVGKPHFELRRVNDDGTSSIAQVAPVGAGPTGGAIDRRSFFGAMIAAGAALFAMSGDAVADDKYAKAKKKCKKKKKKGYKWSKTKKKCVKSKNGSSGSSSHSRTTCSCNQVCTCDLVYY